MRAEEAAATCRRMMKAAEETTAVRTIGHGTTEGFCDEQLAVVALILARSRDTPPRLADLYHVQNFSRERERLRCCARPRPARSDPPARFRVR